jgi:type I restriction enzyme S subunit
MDGAMSTTKTLKSALGRFKPYSAYKASGVGWLGLGEIPADWTAKRLKHLAIINPALTVAGLEGLGPDAEVSFVPMEAVGENGGLDLSATRPIAGVKNGYTFFRNDDVVVAKITPCFENRKGALARGLTNAIAFGTTELHVVRAAAELKPHFLFYTTMSDGFRRLGEAAMYGAAGQKRVPESFIRNLMHPLPPLAEQGAIVAFLDRETAKIDSLVAKKERLIGLLQEKRAALIAHAVTKGLDPNVPMKDSGVEWLGEIPAHWEVPPLKRRAKRIQTGSTPATSEQKYYESGAIPWYGPGSFSDDLPLQKPVKFISDSAVVDGVARLFDAGTVAVVTIGATIGKVAYMAEPGSFNQQITGITFDLRRVTTKFGAYQLKSIEPTLRGTARNTTLPILDQEEVGYLPFLIPPQAEQQAIIASLDRETARIDLLVDKIREAIDRLKELRTALISAAVTGKIEVRGEAA